MAELVYAFALIMLSATIMAKGSYFLQQDFINKINKEAKTWKAGVNFNPNTPENFLVNPFGSKEVPVPPENNRTSLSYKHNHRANNLTVEIPKTFDAREQWINCSTIGVVHDQGCCFSSWAISVSSAFADRLCIATNNDFNKPLSAEQLLFCCKDCWHNESSTGCAGGHAWYAWKFLSDNGIVTGGKFGTLDGCAPYTVDQCNPGEESFKTTRRCPETCDGDFDINFTYDHKNTMNTYVLDFKDIQNDIMTYGPVTAFMGIYEDFYSYKSGVYIKSKNAKRMTDVYVKLIGWGVEDGTPYWLCVNTFGEGWGDSGLFKIRRGKNECNIESNVYAGLPLVYV